MPDIAILSDIHGNSIALQAVLEDIRERGGVDAYWVLGDLAAMGHDPVRVLESLSQLPGVQFVRGNTDSYLIQGKAPVPPAQEMVNTPERLQMHLHLIAGLAWTGGALAVTGWMPWMQALPLEMRQELPDGARVLCAHAAPGADDGPGIHPAVEQETLAAYARSAKADLVCVGHTHWPIDIEVDGVRFFNPGSVSNPVTENLQASYAILHAGLQGYSIERRTAAYDHQAVIEALLNVRHPAAEYIVRFQRGENKPGWARPQKS